MKSFCIGKVEPMAHELFDSLTDEQRQRVVDAIIKEFSSRLMDQKIRATMKAGGPPVDTWMYPPGANVRRAQREIWENKRALLVHPSKMVIDAEYEIVN